MTEQVQLRVREAGAENASASPKQTGQHPISCTHCRQRKVKCDKVYPCTACQRSGLHCVFPERVRHPKKKRSSSKAANDELIRRLGRMEELIKKMEVEGKDISGARPMDIPGSISPETPQSMRSTSEEARRPSHGGADGAEEGIDRYIASSYFRSLTSEVEALRETMNNDSDLEETSPESIQSAPSDTGVAQFSVLFSSTLGHAKRHPRALHPFPPQISVLFSFYIRNVDPMAKILHIPTMQKLVVTASANLDNIRSGNYVEPLLFAMYYAAVTSLTPDQCLQYFQEERDSLLVRYRAGTETALANADLLNTNELGTLQALVMFLTSVRSNDDSQFAWTLTSVAVRLGHSMGLHRENNWSGISPFVRELRRRLWWQLIHLDVRGCEDRGSDPIILASTFNTKPPLNINDSDMDPESMDPIRERVGFTEMTKSHVSHLICGMAEELAYFPEAREGQTPSGLSFEAKEAWIVDIEQRLEKEVLVYCDPQNPVAWVTSVVTRLILARLRLALYHPTQHVNRSASHRLVTREEVLKTAVEGIEYSHLLDTEPAAAQWRWFFNTHVQWHALAATLAELCVQDKGSLVERAWKIVDVVFDDWAALIADSKNGMLWRPIKKLMSKAQARRKESKMRVDRVIAQKSLPNFGLSSFNHLQGPGLTVTPFSNRSSPGMSQESTASQSLGQDQEVPSDVFASLNVDGSSDTINWAEWDEFMQDFAMEDQPNFYPIDEQQDARHLGTFW